MDEKKPAISIARMDTPGDGEPPFFIIATSKSFWYILTGRWPDAVLALPEGTEIRLSPQTIRAETEGLAARFARSCKTARIYPLAESHLPRLLEAGDISIRAGEASFSISGVGDAIRRLLKEG
jgi:hypothetical protein